MPSSVELTLHQKLPAIWLALLLLLALILPHRVWTTLLIGFGGLLLIAYIWARTLARGLSADRQLRARWVSVGDRLWEQFSINHTGLLPALWVEVQDDSNVPGYRPTVVRSVGNGLIRWQQDAICQQRGQFHIGPWRLVTGDPFGIFRVTLHLPQVTEIVIHPPIHSQLPIPLPAGQSSGRVRARERAFQATSNAASVRPYQPTDPFRWIHWRKTAQTDALQVRQFDLDASGDVWLLLDQEASQQLGQGIDSTEEHGVIIAAALAARALRQNRAVGLAAYGQQPQIINSGRGEGQQWRLLRALALTRADGRAPLTVALRDLRRIARRGTAAVIITANGGAEWLPALWPLAQAGIQAHVILLDRPSFGGSGHSTALQEQVRRQNVGCHIIHRGELGRAPDQERHGFWEFKVTRTGKVVTVKTPFD